MPMEKRHRPWAVCIVSILCLGSQVHAASPADGSCDAAMVGSTSHPSHLWSRFTIYLLVEGRLPAPSSDLVRVLQVALEVYGKETELNVYFAVPSLLGALPPHQKPSAVPLLVAEPEDACSPLKTRHLAGEHPPCAAMKFLVSGISTYCGSMQSVGGAREQCLSRLRSKIL